MEMDEVADHHLGEEVDLMDVNKETDSSISKRFLNVVLTQLGLLIVN